MEREIITTGDGSKTIQIKGWNEQYHSKHGAIQEAYHVFIAHGLDLFEKTDLAILEIGFGTGLNAFITLLECGKKRLNISYTGVEAFPVAKEEIEQLEYANALGVPEMDSNFKKLHDSKWNEAVAIAPDFYLEKQQMDFKDITAKNLFNLIYFDAFGARVQPELWTVSIFSKMFDALKSKGYIVTYAAKGSVRRAMQEVGFLVERLPGPPGKREMLRGFKP